jgi:hypothetical protein
LWHAKKRQAKNMLFTLLSCPIILIGLVQQPGWLLNKSWQNAPHFAVFSGCCSETEVSEQLYYKAAFPEDTM